MSLSYLVWLVVGVVVHELAHALVATACGGTVTGVTIGQGPVLVRFRVGRLPFALRLLPLSGLTQWTGAAAARRPVRLAVSLAGCAANLACAAGGLAAGDHGGVLSAFVLANGLLGIYNLVPFALPGGGASDGLTALRVLLGRDDLLGAAALERARREPTSRHAERVRAHLRELVDHAGHVGAAVLLAGLPSGEPGRESRPALVDLGRLSRLMTAPGLPAEVRLRLAGHLAADPTGEPLSVEERAWMEQVSAYARTVG